MTPEQVAPILRRVVAVVWTLLFAYALVGVLASLAGRVLGYPEIVLFSGQATIAALFVMAYAWWRSRAAWADWIGRSRS